MTTATLRDRSVLITGGAGFIGSHLAEALVDENDVLVFDDFSSGAPSNVPAGADLVEGDVRDRDALASAMDGVDVVFHLAAEASVSASVEDPARCHAVNETGTVNVLEAAREADARVVLASSAAIYGHPDSVPIPEDAPTDPSSPYGIGKLSGDHYVRTYNDLYDLPTVALRFFNVYGPGQSGEYAGVITAFVEQARDGGPLTVHGDGEQTRDFVHVSDVVQALELAATTDAVGEAFNVATGSSVTIRELAETIRDIADDDVAITHTDGRDGDIQRSLADVSKARDRLGFEPTVQLEDGLTSLWNDWA
ncbi:GDP-mannose 4,6-dehydratase [Haloarculaceae archaeon H-GB1-1]|nr:GDP-mannose 4,6-dehydratase [Haloarculaceae archaeon H-GB1-1]